VIDFTTLINKYGSPLYVYKLDAITKAYKKLTSSLPEDSILYYSLKANPNPEVTKHLISLGCYAEVSSIGELNTALGAGAHPENCIYTGPGKTKKEVNFALSKNINHFSVESVEELIMIDKLTREFDQSVNITLRINPAFNVGKASIKMTGLPSQFGFDEESIDVNLIQSIIKKNERLKINGFHIYNGSNFYNVDVIEENFRNTLNTVINLKEKLSLKLEFINFGGGFAAPFGKKEPLPSYKQLRKRLENLLEDKLKCGTRPKIAFESGRYLTATCGTLIGTVQSVKTSKGKRYCIVDFGINHIGGMSGLRRIPTVELQLTKLNSSVSENIKIDNMNIVGPLCTPLDYLAKNISLEYMEPGDIVFVSNVGAYGLTGSLLGFLSREIPKEVIIHNKEIQCVHSIELVRKLETREIIGVK